MTLIRETKCYSDFETTTAQESTTYSRVWSAATIIGGTENEEKNVAIQTSIDEYMKYLFYRVPGNKLKVYFHNLKFDGTFILSWLLRNRAFKPAVIRDAQGMVCGLDRESHDWEMKPYTYTYTISSKGMWYSIVIKIKKKVITIWDSLKLLPQSLKALAKGFKTQHQKLEMEYTGHKPNGPITEEERHYICNDVLVLKEAMEIMARKDIESMTIGGACLAEFQMGYKKEKLGELFPDLTTYAIPDVQFRTNEMLNKNRNADRFIRRSYHGGFCYVNPKYKGKVIATDVNEEHDVIADAISHVDANSHYPSMMHSKSGNYYPVGEPMYFTKDQFEVFRVQPKTKVYYFIRVYGSFEIKPDSLPTLQIKDDPRFYKERNEWLTSSHGYKVDLVLTCQDYEKLLENYNVEMEIIEGIAFKTQKGLFDEYIDQWYAVKEKATGAERQIAKLFLNNLYGKFAASTDSSYKMAEIGAHGQLQYFVVEDHSKTPGYIAIGSAITSYARNRTITLAEAYLPYYVYSDTDSNVFLLPEEKLVKIPKHPTAICYWDVESESDKAVFARQKTYIEHVKGDGCFTWNIKACGMGSASKAHTRERLENGMSLREYTTGYEAMGTLKAKQVDGGTILVDVGFRMK